MAKVAVLGGGMGGLETAFELIERGFEVEVFEKGAVFGGKARSLNRWGTGTDGRRDLPGEHGFRFFPGFYKHTPDSMARITAASGTGTVFDDLVPTIDVTIAQAGRPFVQVPARFPQNPAEWLAVLKDLHDRAALGIPSDEIDFFIRRMIDVATACQGRLMTTYETTDWWSFIGANTRSEQYQKILAVGLTRSLVAMRAEQSSSRTVGVMLLQILIYVIRPGSATDRVLNGPTTDVWIDPWVAYLTAKGVTMHLDAEVTALGFDGTRITDATVTMGDGSVRNVQADYFVAAMPIERFIPLVTAPMIAKAPSLGTLHELGVEWMNGIVFYLNRDVPIAQGHIILVDSTWAVTCISQPQFWTGVNLSTYGDGSLKGLLSVDISDWKTKGTYTTTKTAEACSSLEIARETWAQLKASLPELTDADLLHPLDDATARSWFLDPDIDTRATEPGVEATGNTIGERGLQPAGSVAARVAHDSDAEPLLINTNGSWYKRPDAATGIPNLFLAADYVRTNTDLATMEGANEAGRRAVNALLVQAGSSAEPCQVWPLEQMGIFAPFRWLDSLGHSLGLPQIRWGFLWKIAATIAKFILKVLRAIGGRA